MAKRVKTILKLQLPAGAATPAPPVGPALGQHGINIMGFVKEYNARTANQAGTIIPAEITVFEDKSFTFITKTPPAPELIRKALGDKKGICRYGFFILPMDETLARVVLDLSGRACLVYEVEPSTRYIKELDVRLFHEFFQALTNNLALNLHVDVIRGEDVHHVFEGVFKAFARALDCATSLEPREKGVPTTKGMLD